MPTTASPGTGAWIRTVAARNAIDRSSARLTIWLTLIPEPGSSLHIVTHSPVPTSTPLAAPPGPGEIAQNLIENAPLVVLGGLVDLRIFQRWHVDDRHGRQFISA